MVVQSSLNQVVEFAARIRLKIKTSSDFFLKMITIHLLCRIFSTQTTNCQNVSVYVTVMTTVTIRFCVDGNGILIP